jgi:glyoxylase-like metal-dependent hydrolase (beta-lactamase superfamily II)
MKPTFELGPVRVYAGDKNGKYPDGNQVIVEGRARRAVFDSPLVANRIGADFDEADLVIQGHVHEDHVAGLHRLPGVPVYVHKADLAAMQSWEGLGRAYGLEPEVLARMLPKVERDFHYAPRPDALGYEDGAEWDLGGGVRVRAIHLPGHTSGHCGLLVEPTGVVFIGDIDLTGFGPYYGDATSSLRAFRASLARLPDIPARVWVTSHHRGVYTDRDRMLADLAAFAGKIDQRGQRLLSLLREQPRTLDELVAIRLIYPPAFEELWVDAAERYSITMHLEELLDTDAVTRDEDGRYRPR